MASVTTSSQQIQKRFEEAGFAVSAAEGGKIEVSKASHVASLEKQGGDWDYPGPPFFIVHGIKCELEDRGYQKFWFSKSDGKRYPIRKVDLRALHDFDEEVRYLLGMSSLYHESLGSRNARTVYDRLTGRPDR